VREVTEGKQFDLKADHAVKNIENIFLYLIHSQDASSQEINI